MRCAMALGRSRGYAESIVLLEPEMTIGSKATSGRAADPGRPGPCLYWKLPTRSPDRRGQARERHRGGSQEIDGGRRHLTFKGRDGGPDLDFAFEFRTRGRCAEAASLGEHDWGLHHDATATAADRTRPDLRATKPATLALIAVSRSSRTRSFAWIPMSPAFWSPLV
jgi:hypothetical protein